MSNNNRGNVRCRVCNDRFTFEEWKYTLTCENPNCNCPHVKESMRLATDVLDKMKSLGGKMENRIVVKSSDVPTGISDIPRGSDRLYYDCPKVMSITVTPPNARGINLISKKSRGGK